MKVKKEYESIIENKVERLKKIIPGVFTENKIDFDKFERFFKEDISNSNEKYSLNWSGKSDSIKNIKTNSKLTLIPDKKESVNFDTTENLFIEGDNLEVLKLLHKSYFGQIKLIYIDPPYNTGNDFVYNDDFKDSKKAYLEQTGQTKDGIKQTTNTKVEGRYHSNWLSMMYPRLFVAHSLLKEDGVIFVSIDDNEVHNLRHVMDEIFGEENLITILKIQMRNPERQLNEKAYFQKSIEYLLVYCKNINSFNISKKEIKYNFDEYKYKIIEKTKGKKIKIGNKEVFVFNPEEYEIIKTNDIIDSQILKSISIRGKIKTAQNTGKFYEKYLRPFYNSEKDCDMLYKVINMGDDGIGYRYIKHPSLNTINGVYYQGIPLKYRDDLENAVKIKSWPDFLNYIEDNIKAGDSLKEIFNKKIFDTPKPISLIKWICSISSEKKDLILDFFAGSGTTAHAVLDLNKEDGGNRKFICVQLPEETTKDSIAYKEGYKTIAEVCKERIRRIINKIKNENNEKIKDLDLGFKVFKLSDTNYDQWDDNIDDINTLKKQIKLFESSLIPNYKDINVIYEIIIKEGYSLNSKIKQISGISNIVYIIIDDSKQSQLYLSLDKKINSKIIDELKLSKDDVFICLDSALDDSLKQNLSKVLEANEFNNNLKTI